MGPFHRDRRSEQPNEDQVIREFLDQRHPRASAKDGAGGMIIDPGKVLDNIAHAMERLDLDINTPVSIEEDVLTLEELGVLVTQLRMGPLLAIHVVNTAMRIMARYPAELVRAPLPEQYDLRRRYPFSFSDLEHGTAKGILNRRMASVDDLDQDDVQSEFEPLCLESQMQVFIALFFMFGNKIGALKSRTGIE